MKVPSPLVLHCTPILFDAVAVVIWKDSPSHIWASEPASAKGLGIIVIVVFELAETVQGAIGLAINVKFIVPLSFSWEI